MTRSEGALARCSFKLKIEASDEALAIFARQLDTETAKRLLAEWVRAPENWEFVDDVRTAALLRMASSGVELRSTNPAYYSVYKHINWMVSVAKHTSAFKKLGEMAGLDLQARVIETKPLASVVAEQLLSNKDATRDYPYTVRDVATVPDTVVMRPEETYAADYSYYRAARLKWEWLRAGNRVKNGNNPEGRLPSEMGSQPDDVVFKPGMHLLSPETLEEIKREGLSLGDPQDGMY